MHPTQYFMLYKLTDCVDQEGSAVNWWQRGRKRLSWWVAGRGVHCVYMWPEERCACVQGVFEGLTSLL